MSPRIFIPENEIERGLQKLPKDCNCMICKFQKAEAKARLGEQRYTFVVSHIGLDTKK